AGDVDLEAALHHALHDALDGEPERLRFLEHLAAALAALEHAGDDDTVVAGADDAALDDVADLGGDVPFLVPELGGAHDGLALGADVEEGVLWPELEEPRL